MLDEFSQPEAAQVNGDCGVTKLSSISPQVVGVEWQCRTYMTDPTKYFTYYYITPDGGQSWYSWKSTGNESFFNADMGWRLYSPDPAQLSQLQKTTDGGLDWVNIKEVAWQSARFEFISEQVGWAIVSIGDVTALLRTNDGGKTWVVLK
jgi:hypothetical protein